MPAHGPRHDLFQCTLPGAPGSPAATAGANSATVTWTAASGNGSTITAYVVRETAGPDVGASIGAPAAATQAVINGLAGGTAATLEIVAVTSCGEGPGAVAPAVTPTGSATTYLTSVLGASPSTYYRFGEPATTTLIADSSGNALDGAYSGQETLGQPAALADDPSTSASYSTCCSGFGTSPAVPPSYNSARTVQFWVETTNAGNNPGVVSWGTYSTDQDFIVGIDPEAITIDGRNDYQVIPAGHSLNDGTWHMVTVTYDGTTITGYLDGTQIGTALFNGTLDTLGGGLAIGNVPGYNQFNGYLQDVAIYPTALTSAQVSAQFAASGYALPGKAVDLHVSTGGNNAATVTWGIPSGTDTGVRVSVATGPNAGQAVILPARSTGARLYGLAAGAQTFTVTAFNTFGTGPSTTSAAYTVPGAASTYASTVLADSPTAFYRLGDTGSGALADSSGNRADGVYSTSNVTLQQPGPLANDPTQAVSTGSNNQGVGTVRNAVVPTYNSPRTVEAWINTTQNTSGMTVASWGVPGTNTAMAVYVYNNDIAIDGYNDNQVFPTPYAINDGVWHMIDLTYDGTTITAYLDGVAIGTGHFSATLDTLPGGLNLGLSVWGSAQYYNSSLGDVSVYQTALSAARVGAHFAAAGFARPGAPGSPNATAGGNSATVTWTAAASGGSAVKDYLVSAVLAGKSVNSQSVPGSATSTTISGLKGGTAYAFTITASNSYGAGATATTAVVTPTGAASTYASTVLSDKPSVFYRLGDTSTNVMADSSGHRRGGSYSAANVTQGASAPLPNDPTTSTSTGSNNQGVGSYPQAVLPTYNSPRSVEAWVNSTQNTNGMAVVSWGTSGTNQGMAVCTYNNAIAIDGYNDNQVFPTPYPINDGVWHLIDLTYNGTTITAYLDGVAIGTGKFAAKLDTLPGALNVGLTVWGSNQYYNSSLADVSVYQAALSAARVAAHFAASGDSRPGAPGSASVTAGANSAAVSWTAAASPASPVKDYLVTALLAGKQVNSQSVPAAATSTTINGLQGGSAYTFTVSAADSYGYGPAATTTAVTPTGAASTYASTVLADSPTVFYRLGDTAAAAMASSSGSSDNGTYSASNVSFGASGPILGDPTTATATGSNNQGVGTFPGAVLPTYNSARSVEAWVNSTQNTGGMTLVSWGTSGTNQGMAVYMYNNAIAIDGYNDNQVFPTPYPINDGVWHQVDLTYDGTTITAYLDGAAIGTGHFANPLNTLPGGLDVGLTVWGGAQYYNSALADVSVYPTALPAARVAAHFAASGYSPPSAPGLPSATAGANSASVSWTAASSPGSAIKDYLVTALLAGRAVNSQSVPATATSTTISGLQGGSAYTFTVSAANSYGYGAAAATAAVTPTGASSTYASTVLSDKPTVFYRLGDSASAAMANSSGGLDNGSYSASNVTFGASGPIVGDPTTSTSTGGNGQGVGTFPHSVLPTYNTSRTIEAWVNSTQNTNAMTLVSWGTSGTNQGMSAYMYNGDIAIDGYSDNQVFPTPYAINDGVWHLIDLTYNGTKIVAYLDGVQIGTGHFSGKLNTAPNGLDVGVSTWGGNQFYNSSLADVAVYPTALSAARVAAHFAASGYSRPAAPGSPVASAGTNAAIVSWTAASSPGSAIKGYLLSAVLGGKALNSQFVPASVTSSTVYGLQGGSAYTFTITAVNSYGLGATATTAGVTPTGSATTYASGVLALAPSVFYRLGDTAPAILADSSGNGLNGIYNGPNVTLGGVGAISGDPSTSAAGNGNYIGTARPTLPLYSQNRSVEAWAKTTQGNAQYIVGWGSQGTAEGFDVAIGPTTVYVQGYSDDLQFTSTITLDDGNWHFIAVTSNGTSATVYVDGTSMGTQSFPQVLNTLPNQLVVGGSIWGSSGINGSLDDLAIFPTILTQAQIQAEFTGGAHPALRPVSPLPARVGPGSTQPNASLRRRAIGGRS